MSYQATHHSFCVELAIKYKVEKATIIHHFQHWIKLNRRKDSKKHFREGRWWTYQTHSDLHDFLPYLSEREIKHLVDQLANEDGVLIKGNFNKSSIDKTTWYAFQNENEFLGDPENSNNDYERQNCPSTDKNGCPSDKFVPPIPDPIPDPKATDSKIHDKGQKAKPSANASALADFFLKKIIEKKADFKPQSFSKWAFDFDLMLKEGRSIELAKEMICWLVEDLKNLVYVQSASKFRKDFDRIEMQMQVKRESAIKNENRQMALQAKEKYPVELKKMKFDDKFVSNPETGKEIPWLLPKEQFIEAFGHLFGGQHVR